MTFPASFDARDWSAAFCREAADMGYTLDDDWVAGWFAGALMRGWSERAKASQFGIPPGLLGNLSGATYSGARASLDQFCNRFGIRKPDEPRPVFIEGSE